MSSLPVTEPITLADIKQGLARDPRFQGDQPGLDYFAGYLAELPGLIGAERLGHLATFSELMQVTAEFLQYLLGTPCGQGFRIRGLYAQAAQQLGQIAAHTAEFLDSVGATEEQVMLSPQAGLLPELRDLYRAGRLTIGDIVRHQPGKFIPEIAEEEED